MSRDIRDEIDTARLRFDVGGDEERRRVLNRARCRGDWVANPDRDSVAQWSRLREELESRLEPDS